MPGAGPLTLGITLIGRILQLLVLIEPEGVHKHFLQSFKSSILLQEWRPASIKLSIFQYIALRCLADSVGLASRAVRASCSSEDMAEGALVRVEGWALSERLCWYQAEFRVGIASHLSRWMMATFN